MRQFGNDELALPRPQVGGRLSSDGAQLSVLEPTGDIDHLLAQGAKIRAAATVRGTRNVLDGGYKKSLMLSLFNVRKLDKEGDDAEARRYEMQTVARVSSYGKRKASLSTTTEHTLTQSNVDRYRATILWIVSVFDQALPEVICEIPSADLEPYFAVWEEKLARQGQPMDGAPHHLNSPRTLLNWIMRHGVQVWPRTRRTSDGGAN